MYNWNFKDPAAHTFYERITSLLQNLLINVTRRGQGNTRFRTWAGQTLRAPGWFYFTWMIFPDKVKSIQLRRILRLRRAAHGSIFTCAAKLFYFTVSLSYKQKTTGTPDTDFLSYKQNSIPSGMESIILIFYLEDSAHSHNWSVICRRCIFNSGSRVACMYNRVISHIDGNMSIITDNISRLSVFIAYSTSGTALRTGRAWQ